MKWMRYGLSATVLITGFALNAKSQTAGPAVS